MKHFYTRRPFRRKKKTTTTSNTRPVGSHGFDGWSRNNCPCANYSRDLGVAVPGELNRTNSYQNYTSIANESYLSKVIESVELLSSIIELKFSSQMQSFSNCLGSFKSWKHFFHIMCKSYRKSLNERNELYCIVYCARQNEINANPCSCMNAFGKIAFITARIIARRACRWYAYTFVVASHEKSRRKRVKTEEFNVFLAYIHSSILNTDGKSTGFECNSQYCDMFFSLACANPVHVCSEVVHQSNGNQVFHFQINMVNNISIKRVRNIAVVKRICCKCFRGRDPPTLPPWQDDRLSEVTEDASSHSSLVTRSYRGELPVPMFLSLCNALSGNVSFY